MKSLLFAALLLCCCCSSTAQSSPQQPPQLRVGENVVAEQAYAKRASLTQSRHHSTIHSRQLQTNDNDDNNTPYYYSTTSKLTLGGENFQTAMNNPMKGLFGSQRYLPLNQWDPDFPSSLSIVRVGLDEVMLADPRNVGWNKAFDFTVVEEELDLAASYGKQVIFSFFISWPGQEMRLPEYLDGTVESVWKKNTQTQVPKFDDPALKLAMKQFITEFGSRYDGDSRLAFIQMGLLGYFGEWHTLDDPTLVPESVKKEMVQWYSDSFYITPIMTRYPMYEAIQAGHGIHDDSYGFTTLDDGSKEQFYYTTALLRNITSEKGIVAEDFWKKGPMGGEIRPEIADRVFRLFYRDGPEKQQDINECTTVLHTTMSGYANAFDDGGLNGFNYENALYAHMYMGYAFYVTKVAAVESSRVPTEVSPTTRDRDLQTSCATFEPVRINCGPPKQITDDNGLVWSPDAYATGGVAQYWCRGGDIQEEELLCTRREGQAEYNIPVPTDCTDSTTTYQVRLLFFENANAGIGTRVFDVVVENDQMEENFDIVERAGLNTLAELYFTVPASTITDGALTIQLVPNKGWNPMVSAIEVTKLTTSSDAAAAAAAAAAATAVPTRSPTRVLTTSTPTRAPITVSPTAVPTSTPTAPTSVPTHKPTKSPTRKPTSAPTSVPTMAPTASTVHVDVTVKQIGIAPFYYPLKLALKCPSLNTPIRVSGIEKKLIDKGDTVTVRFEHVPALQECLQDVTIYLDSAYVLENNPIKFAQGDDGILNMRIPLPESSGSGQSSQDESCSNLVQDGSMENNNGSVESLWPTGQRATGFGSDSTGIKFRKSIRSFLTGGIQYNDEAGGMNYGCITPGVTFEIRAQMKLTLPFGFGSSSCSPLTGCPYIEMTVQSKDGGILRTMFDTERSLTRTIASSNVVAGHDNWKTNDWNLVVSQITLPSSLEWDGTIERVSVEVKGFSIYQNVIVDNVQIYELS